MSENNQVATTTTPAKPKTVADYTYSQRVNMLRNAFKAPKDQKAGFGKQTYQSRVAEHMLQKLNPLAMHYAILVYIKAEVTEVDCETRTEVINRKTETKTESVKSKRLFAKSTVYLYDALSANPDKSFHVKGVGFAEIPDALGSQTPPQISGSADTYAKKRAIGDALCVSDAKDKNNIDPDFVQ